MSAQSKKHYRFIDHIQGHMYIYIPKKYNNAIYVAIHIELVFCFLSLYNFILNHNPLKSDPNELHHFCGQLDSVIHYLLNSSVLYRPF